MMTTKKNNYFDHSLHINLARILATHGNCQKRNYGCVIVNPAGEIVSSGHTHTSEKCVKCSRRFRRKGTGYDKCPSIHAEQQAVAGHEIPYGSIAFLACFDAKTRKEIVDPHPCPTCEKLLRSAGVKEVITFTEVITL